MEVRRQWSVCGVASSVCFPVPSSYGSSGTVATALPLAAVGSTERAGQCLSTLASQAGGRQLHLGAVEGYFRGGREECPTATSDVPTAILLQEMQDIGHPHLGIWHE